MTIIKVSSQLKLNSPRYDIFGIPCETNLTWEDEIIQFEYPSTTLPRIYFKHEWRQVRHAYHAAQEFRQNLVRDDHPSIFQHYQYQRLIHYLDYGFHSLGCLLSSTVCPDHSLFRILCFSPQLSSAVFQIVRHSPRCSFSGDVAPTKETKRQRTTSDYSATRFQSQLRQLYYPTFTCKHLNVTPVPKVWLPHYLCVKSRGGTKWLYGPKDSSDKLKKDRSMSWVERFCELRVELSGGLKHLYEAVAFDTKLGNEAAISRG
jgi:hypothetical protein